MFKYQIVNEEEKATVLCKGDMDIEMTEIIEEQLIPALQKYKQVEMNCADVPFVDSTGIGLLINLVQQLKEQGISVIITQLREEVYQVFDLLQIPEIVGREVFPTSGL